MKNTFKKNPALFIGLALPLLMILIFSGIPFIASFVVEPPQYNFIYSYNNYNDINGKLKVIDGQLILQAHNTWQEPREAQQTLYLVHVDSKKSTKLNLRLEKGETSLIPPRETRNFIVEGVSLKELDTSNLSPDGYKITSETETIFALLFFFGNNTRQSLSIKKSGRTVNIPLPESRYGGKFEGWIIPQ
jgi:hypothetical protein